MRYPLLLLLFSLPRTIVRTGECHRRSAVTVKVTADSLRDIHHLQAGVAGSGSGSMVTGRPGNGLIDAEALYRVRQMQVFDVAAREVELTEGTR